jgi:glycosyltransferase involved in cell wall biosynthesis
VVINDGKDPLTRQAIESLKLPFPLQYAEIEHSEQHFGLCLGRNVGLAIASGNLITYLDDDNALRPEFVQQITAWFAQNPNFDYCLPQQWRRRDVKQNGQTVKQGTPFVSPAPDTTIEDLLTQRSLFDSNGFTHRRNDSLIWNPTYRIFCDYEFFLQCLDQRRNCDRAFKLLPEILVDYIQTTEGVIGASTYCDWVDELLQLSTSRFQYDSLNRHDTDWLEKAIEQYQGRGHQPVSAFQL